MTHALRFLPQVDLDVWSGRTWYEEKLACLGESGFPRS